MGYTGLLACGGAAMKGSVGGGSIAPVAPANVSSLMTRAPPEGHRTEGVRCVCWLDARYSEGTHQLAVCGRKPPSVTHRHQDQNLGFTSGFKVINQLLPTTANCFKKRWRRESNPCARLCRPLPHHSATPPQGLMPLAPSSGRRDSNPRPSPWQGDALPTALRPRATSGIVARCEGRR